MVLRVVVGLQRYTVLDRAAGDLQSLALATLLRGDGRQEERAELEAGLQTKERLAAADKRAWRLKLHVARLDSLDDIIVALGAATEGDLQLVVEIEGALGLEIRRHLQLVADLAGDRHLDILVEKRGRLCGA